MKAIATIVCLLCTATPAIAQEKRIQRSELPAVVEKAADEQSKGAKVRGYAKEIEHGQVSYEIQLQVDGHAKDVSISPDGTVVEVEEEVAFAALPEQVRMSLQSRAGQGKIVRVESLTKRGKLVAYEAQVRSGSKRHEIQVAPDGQRLAHPE